MAAELDPLFARAEQDDKGGHSHRLLIGVLGMALPIVLCGIAAWRPTKELDGRELLSSVSAYYYTGAVAVFCGILVALAVFFFTYDGYRNERRPLDRVAAIIAGCAALLVAAYPTDPPDPALQPSWWTPFMGWIHLIAAVVLFLDFAFFCLVLFPGSHPQRKTVARSKKVRNSTYRVCGVAMLACIAWAGYAKFSKLPIFWPETLALWFFGISWLVKGRVEWTACAGSRRALHYTLHPGQLVSDVAATLRGRPPDEH